MAAADVVIDVKRLIDACSDQSRDAGISIRTVLEPIAGFMSPVKPATYAPARTGDPPRFQEDERWWGDPPEKTRVIVIDNVPSQANRLEAALHGLRSELGLPELVLDLSGMDTLPSHLPDQLSSFRFPHRQGDAYLRDAELDGKAFTKTDLGRALLDATSDRPGPLFQWFPQALLFGYWQSHLGKKRTQSKLARSWTSEIAGYAPATREGEHTRLIGTKGDPLNLSADERVEYDDNDLLGGWEQVAGSRRAAGSRQRETLAEIGHGQVPYGDGALAGVSFQAIEQRATVSFASLRRIRGHDAATSALGRVLLVALGLVGQVAAFGRPFTLRSGCELRPVRSSWIWLGAEGNEHLARLSEEQAITLLRECSNRAEAAGVTSGGGWGSEPLVLRPNGALQKAISATWPLSK